MLMKILKVSPTVIDIHTPFIPRICGSISTGITMKMIVLQNDKIADVFPSFNAVNHPDPNTLYAIIGKLVATIRNPCSAICLTCSLFFAKNPTKVPPAK